MYSFFFSRLTKLADVIPTLKDSFPIQDWDRVMADLALALWLAYFFLQALDLPLWLADFLLPLEKFLVAGLAAWAGFRLLELSTAAYANSEQFRSSTAWPTW
jgi:hypothetical protein